MYTLLLLASLGTSPSTAGGPADAPLALQTASGAAEPERSVSLLEVPEAPLPPAAREMTVRMEDYLDAERAESRLFVGVGALALAGGAVALAASDDPMLRGASLPVMGVGLIQLVVGGSVWWRTEAQKAALRAQIRSAPGLYVSEETERMRVVNGNFAIYRWTELSLLAAGVATGATGYALDEDFVTGVGLGLAVQSALMLGLDYFAEKRGATYARQVGAFRF
jgi:hypothetical protein